MYGSIGFAGFMTMDNDNTNAARTYGLRPGAEEFPLMIVISVIYPCNFGCPNCPYTDGNSEIRQFYKQRQGDLLPVPLWEKIADEAGPYGSWLRCTGGGGPGGPARVGAARPGGRRAALAPPHGGHDRVRQGERRPRLAQHQRQPA